jgi:tetratricopeptide (TPR) repeat protein
MQDDTSPSQAPQMRQARGNALNVALGVIAFLAIAAAAYFWRGQQSASFERHAAQAAQAERHFKAAKGTIEAMVSGVADSLAGTGIKPQVAQAVLAKLEAAIDKLVVQTEKDPDIRRGQAVMYLHFADAYLRLGDSQLGVDSARKATKIFRAMAEQKPNDNVLQSDVGLSLEKLGQMLRASGDLKGSLASYRESEEIARAISSKDPSNVQWRIDFVLSLWRLAAMGDEPRERLTEALKILQHLKLAGVLSADQKQWIATIERDLLNLN